MIKYLFLFFALIFISIAKAAPSDSIRVYVTDEKEKPVQGIRVAIDQNKAKTTNNKGYFSFVPSRKLEVPFECIIETDGFVLDEYEYVSTEKTIYVSVKRISIAKIKLLVKFENGEPVSNYTFNVKGKEYSTNFAGFATLSNDKIESKDLMLNDELVSFDQSGKEWVIVIRKKEVEEMVVDHVAEEEKIDTVKTAFQQYKQEFLLIEKELEFERNQIDQLDANLKNQLSAITQKLKNEKSLSEQEKEELLKYEAKLYKDIADNIDRFNQSKKKVFEMMENMRFSLLKKDSINKIMEERLKLEEEKLLVVKMQAKRQATIYIIIIITMLLLAFVFYGIARKIRSQKKELSKANESIELKFKDTQSRLMTLRNQILDFYLHSMNVLSSQDFSKVAFELTKREMVSVFSLLPKNCLVDKKGKDDWEVTSDIDFIQSLWDEIALKIGLDSWENTIATIEKQENKYIIRLQLESDINLEDEFWENVIKKTDLLNLFKVNFQQKEIIIVHQID